jgi:hypothetical protein
LYGGLTPGLGGWCYAQAFVEYGWTVIGVDDETHLVKYARSFPHRIYRKLWNRVRETDRAAHLAVLNRAVRENRPRMVVILKGAHVGPSEVREYQREGAWVVNINHDDYFSRTRSNRSALLSAALPAYDYLLTPRTVNCDELRGINPRVAYFPFSYLPALHRPVPVPPNELDRWAVDVVFVGTYAPHRVGLLEFLVTTVRGSYAIYGGNWHKLSRRSPLRPYVRMHPVLFDDMAKAFGGAKVSLGFLRKGNRDDYTQRTFEVPACGGVLLAERTAKHRAIYREGVEAAFFDADRPGELAEQARRLIGDEGYRESIRAAGLAAVRRSRFTYQDRVAQLLTLYEARPRP